MSRPPLSPRTAIMLVFAAFGSLIGLWAGSIPLVTLQAGVSSYQLGVGLAASTLVSVLSMSLGGVIGKHFSNRAVLLVLLPLDAVLTLGLMSSGSALLFFLFIMLQGAVMGLTDIFMNAEASAIEHDMQKPIFTAFHGGASLSMAIFAIVSSLVSAWAGPAVSACIGVLCVLIAFAATWHGVLPRSRSIARVGRVGHLWRHVPLLLIGLAVGLSITAETTAIFWSGKLIQEQFPALASFYGIGAAFFGLCAAAVRFAGDKLRARYGEMNLLLLSFATGAVGYSILGLSLSLEINALAFASIGLGLAVVCPCLFLMAAGQLPGNRVAGMAVVSLVAGIPRVVAPWAIGWVATSSSLSYAFGLAAFVPLSAIVIILWLRANQQRVVAS